MSRLDEIRKHFDNLWQQYDFNDGDKDKVDYLLSLIDEAKGMISEMEFDGWVAYGEPRCQVCGREEYDGHKDDCPVKAWLDQTP